MATILSCDKKSTAPAYEQIHHCKKIYKLGSTLERVKLFFFKQNHSRQRTKPIYYNSTNSRRRMRRLYQFIRFMFYNYILSFFVKNVKVFIILCAFYILRLKCLKQIQNKTSRLTKPSLSRRCNFISQSTFSRCRRS